MPRFRRTIRPGDLVHVICRFVNREFRLTSRDERNAYLHYLGKGVTRSDWRLLSYALMSTHIHLAMIAGVDAFGWLFKTINAPFSNWINVRQERLGPVFAGRPSTIITSPALAGQLISYQHNNPPRAFIVSTARDSDWTSHQAYMGRVPCPGWLDVTLGLELMGFGTDVRGREGFERYVLEHQANTRDDLLTGDVQAASRKARHDLGVAVSVAHPRTGPKGVDYAPHVDARRWQGDLQDVVDIVARDMGTTSLLVSGSSRSRDIVAVRRVVVQLGRRLGCSNREIGLFLGVSEGAVRKLEARAGAGERERAVRLLGTLDVPRQ